MHVCSYMCTCLLTSVAMCILFMYIYNIHECICAYTGLLYPIKVHQPAYLSEHSYFLIVTGFMKTVLVGTQTKTHLLPIFNS